MNLRIASAAWLALCFAFCTPCSVSAQSDAGRSVETKQVSTNLPDSDGDGIPDRDDPHAFIADITCVSWRISPLSLGWKADSSLNEQVTVLDEHEKEILERKQFTFGGQMRGINEQMQRSIRSCRESLELSPRSASWRSPSAASASRASR